ncbi:MAG TPA: carboxypeptidase-like regulatory domain-containing protein [Pyrinomonadaceae bacterium]|nr:carboxypeptidase-like regulatory domain-containing protein [Pyrinomonadaceae bacterium]
MKQRQLRILLLVLSLVLLTLPLINAHGAGGRIEGKVIDPKGAAIAGAIVTVTDPVSNQNFRAMVGPCHRLGQLS